MNEQEYYSHLAAAYLRGYALRTSHMELLPPFYGMGFRLR